MYFFINCKFLENIRYFSFMHLYDLVISQFYAMLTWLYLAYVAYTFNYSILIAIAHTKSWLFLLTLIDCILHRKTYPFSTNIFLIHATKISLPVLYVKFMIFDECELNLQTIIFFYNFIVYICCSSFSLC
jgi:hypothetical protein